MGNRTGEPSHTPHADVDDSEMLRQAQERIRQVLDDAEDVSYSTCTACRTLIMYIFTITDRWRWIAVLGPVQRDVPSAQCPKVPGPDGVGYGPHQPRGAEIPSSTGELP